MVWLTIRQTQVIKWRLNKQANNYHGLVHFYVLFMLWEEESNVCFLRYFRQYSQQLPTPILICQFSQAKLTSLSKYTQI